MTQRIFGDNEARPIFLNMFGVTLDRLLKNNNIERQMCIIIKYCLEIAIILFDKLHDSFAITPPGLFLNDLYIDDGMGWIEFR